MKRLAVIAVVVFTTLTLQSCRQSDEVMSPEEVATFQRVQDSSNNFLNNNSNNTLTTEQGNVPASLVDGEILPPPKK